MQYLAAQAGPGAFTRRIVERGFGPSGDFTAMIVTGSVAVLAAQGRELPQMPEVRHEAPADVAHGGRAGEECGTAPILTQNLGSRCLRDTGDAETAFEGPRDIAVGPTEGVQVEDLVKQPSYSVLALVTGESGVAQYQTGVVDAVSSADRSA